METHRRLCWIAMGGLLFAVVPLLSAWPMESDSGSPEQADRPTAGASPMTAEGPQGRSHSKQETVGLNFFNATWSSVLRRVAKASDSTLVMEKPPRGRFTRGDRHRYTRTEAVHILNRELEPQGFRILEQGDFLVLLELDAVRARYRRPAVPDAPDEVPIPGTLPSEQAPPFPGYKRQVHTITSRDQPAVEDHEVAEKEPGSQPQPDDAPEPFKPSPARRRLDVADAPPTGEERDSEADDSAEGGQDAEPSTRRIELRHRQAVDVARTIYRAFKPGSELIDVGPEGLPAFQVSRSKAPRVENDAEGRHQNGEWRSRSGTDFTIGIDTAHDGLVVTARPERVRQVAELIATLDSPREESAHAVRLMANSEDARRIAKRLQPVLNRVPGRSEVRGRRSEDRDREPEVGNRETSRRGSEENGAMLASSQDREGGSEEAAPPVEQRREPPSEEGEVPPPPLPPEEPQPEEERPPVQLDLRGPVTVQDVPGVGLVITGAQEDVEAVMQIIEELERAALVMVPDIHLLMLRHVDSAALAELLNSVYEQLAALRAVEAVRPGGVVIVPVVKPNAVLVLAPEAEMESILELAEELDQPVDPQAEFEVFRLKSAVATQAVTLLEEFYEEREGLGTRVTVVADVRTNSLIVQARPRDLAEVAAVIRKIDRDTSGAVNRMQIFPLRNAIADELAVVINAAIQSVLQPPGVGVPGEVPIAAPPVAAPGAEQLQEAKSVVLEFLAVDEEAHEILRSGILADIRITSDPRMNSLLVAAPEQSMPLMSALIRQLDQPSPTVAEIKVFSLANSDATAMAALLRTLFEPDPQAVQLGVQVVGAEDAGSGLIPLRFSVDVRTNSIIAVGGAEALGVVEAILLRLDEDDIRQRQNTVVKLRNSPVIDVALAISQFLTAQRELAQVDPELVTAIELLEREIIVVPEAVSNSLLISATPRYFEEILRLIAQLDEAPPQVIIQALLVEVELINTDEFGVELGFQDSILFNRSLINNIVPIVETITLPTGVQTTTQRIVSQEATPGFAFRSQPLGNNPINPGRVGSQGFSDFSLGRVNPDLGFGGLVLTASSESVSVLIRALAARRTVHILSRPQIRTLDNQLALIQVGQQVPVVRGVTVTGIGAANPIVQPENVGIILEVTPRISPDGTIVMETIATRSALSPVGVPIFTDVTTGQVVESPIIDVTTARTTVSVPNGQTIVMGGMITKQDDALERRVPWLGDIPILGIPFRYDAVDTRRTELLIFLTPRVIRHDADSELIKRVEAERLHFIEREAEEIHGPLYGVPPAHPGKHMEPPGMIFDGPHPLPTPQGEGQERPRLEPEIPTTIMPERVFQPESWPDDPTGNMILEEGATGRWDLEQSFPPLQDGNTGETSRPDHQQGGPLPSFQPPPHE